MTQFTKAMKKSELADGEMKTVAVAGISLMVANINGEYFAMVDACTHNGCSLGTEGKLSGTTVTCGCHGGQFNVTTGKATKPPAVKDGQSYQVKLEGDDVLVSI